MRGRSCGSCPSVWEHQFSANRSFEEPSSPEAARDLRPFGAAFPIRTLIRGDDLSFSSVLSKFTPSSNVLDRVAEQSSKDQYVPGPDECLKPRSDPVESLQFNSEMLAAERREKWVQYFVGRRLESQDTMGQPQPFSHVACTWESAKSEIKRRREPRVDTERGKYPS